MKKDIDLLSGFNEAKGKKSSSNSTVIMIAGVLIIIGLMVFLFVSAKMEIKDKEDIIAGLDSQLSQEGYISQMEQKLETDKATYQALLTEVVKEVNSGKLQDQSAKISSKILEVIYDNYVMQKGADGEYKVKIDFISIDAGKLSMRCSTRNYQDAWDFVDYLRGTLRVEPPAEGATEVEIQAYEARKTKIEANALYFSKIIDSYPGLPVEGDGKDYNIGFALNIDVNWEAMAE